MRNYKKTYFEKKCYLTSPNFGAFKFNINENNLVLTNIY